MISATFSRCAISTSLRVLARVFVFVLIVDGKDDPRLRIELRARPTRLDIEGGMRVGKVNIAGVYGIPSVNSSKPCIGDAHSNLVFSLSLF